MSPRIIVSALALVAFTGAVHAAERLRIVDESRLPATWSPVDAAPQSAVAYPAALADRSADACVSMGFLIGDDGRVRPESLGVLRLWASDGRGTNVNDDSLEPFVQAAATTLLQQRFTPSAGAGAAHEVYTSITLAFVAAPDTPVANVQSRCKVIGLRSFIAEAQAREGYQDDTFRADVGRYSRAQSASYLSSRSNGNLVGTSSSR